MAEHVSVAPPFAPAHVQFQGPDPAITDAVPAEQRFEAGAEAVETPFAEPQAPATTAGHAARVACVLDSGRVRLAHIDSLAISVLAVVPPWHVMVWQETLRDPVTEPQAPEYVQAPVVQVGVAHDETETPRGI